MSNPPDLLVQFIELSEHPDLDIPDLQAIADNARKSWSILEPWYGAKTSRPAIAPLVEAVVEQANAYRRAISMVLKVAESGCMLATDAISLYDMISNGETAPDSFLQTITDMSQLTNGSYQRCLAAQALLRRISTKVLEISKKLPFDENITERTPVTAISAIALPRPLSVIPSVDASKGASTERPLHEKSITDVADQLEKTRNSLLPFIHDLGRLGDWWNVLKINLTDWRKRVSQIDAHVANLRVDASRSHWESIRSQYVSYEISVRLIQDQFSRISSTRIVTLEVSPTKTDGKFPFAEATVESDKNEESEDEAPQRHSFDDDSFEWSQVTPPIGPSRFSRSRSRSPGVLLQGNVDDLVSPLRSTFSHSRQTPQIRMIRTSMTPERDSAVFSGADASVMANAFRTALREPRFSRGRSRSRSYTSPSPEPQTAPPARPAWRSVSRRSRRQRTDEQPTEVIHYDARQRGRSPTPSSPRIVVPPGFVPEAPAAHTTLTAIYPGYAPQGLPIMPRSPIIIQPPPTQLRSRSRPYSRSPSRRRRRRSPSRSPSYSPRRRWRSYSRHPRSHSRSPRRHHRRRYRSYYDRSRSHTPPRLRDTRSFSLASDQYYSPQHHRIRTYQTHSRHRTGYRYPRSVSPSEHCHHCGHRVAAITYEDSRPKSKKSPTVWLSSIGRAFNLMIRKTRGQSSHRQSKHVDRPRSEYETKTDVGASPVKPLTPPTLHEPSTPVTPQEILNPWESSLPSSQAQSSSDVLAHLPREFPKNIGPSPLHEVASKSWVSFHLPGDPTHLPIPRTTSPAQVPAPLNQNFINTYVTPPSISKGPGAFNSNNHIKHTRPSLDTHISKNHGPPPSEPGVSPRAVLQQPTPDSSAPTYTTASHPPNKGLRVQTDTLNQPSSTRSSPSAILDLTGQVRTVEEDLDAGGFSVIHLGEWKCGQTKCEVAIKLLRVLKREDDDGARLKRRLEREVRVWHRLNHPNIVKLFGISSHMGGRPAMIMPWFKNGNAANYLAAEGSGLETIVKLISDVTLGLEYLHTSDPPVVHGDLKGSNILITNDGRAALSDFGLSQILEETGVITTTVTSIAGSMRWQAPEIICDSDEGGQSNKLTTESDIWSFACTAYEMLTGMLPYFQHRAMGPLVVDIVKGVRPVWVRQDGFPLCETPDGLRGLLDWCWSFDPTERPTASDVVSHMKASFV